jgi:hypothetical protein
MAAGCKRTFSNVKKLITQERNALSDVAIEACEFLKTWWDQGQTKSFRTTEAPSRRSSASIPPLSTSLV